MANRFCKSHDKNACALSFNEVASVVADTAARYRAQHAYLFGSWARGEANEHSDVDVLIVGGPSFIPGDIFAIAQDISKKLGCSVDAYEISELDEGPFRDTVMSERLSIA